MRRIAMLNLKFRKFVWILGVALGLCAFTIYGDVNTYSKEYRYRYVPLSTQSELPPGFLYFDAYAINDGGQIYGNIYDDSLTLNVATYQHGKYKVLSPGFVVTANEKGTVGGNIYTDPINYITQAALFYGNKVLTVPPQTGELISTLYDLNDSDTALVGSSDNLTNTYLLYKKGKTNIINFGLNPFISLPSISLHMNNQDIIAGTTYDSGHGQGFRFDPRSCKLTILKPLPTEVDAWSQQINNRGDVLGYSFNAGKTERIGIWDRHANFKTYFVEGTSEYPTNSHTLRFNDNNLIVITTVGKPSSEVGNSYLVPKPGVRLNLADLVINLPANEQLFYITDINNKGDIIGYNMNFESFLLKRIDNKDHYLNW
jgi:hypothetical protein